MAGKALRMSPPGRAASRRLRGVSWADSSGQVPWASGARSQLEEPLPSERGNAARDRSAGSSGRAGRNPTHSEGLAGALLTDPAQPVASLACDG